MVDRRGVPLVVVLTAADVYDSEVFEEFVGFVEPVKRPGRGRPRKRPKKLHADKGYDFPRCRKALSKRDITTPTARRGVESGERLGLHRWVVEQTLSWMGRFRRLKVRYERRTHIHQAFLELGCAHLLAPCPTVLLGTFSLDPESCVHKSFSSKSCASGPPSSALTAGS